MKKESIGYRSLIAIWPDLTEDQKIWLASNNFDQIATCIENKISNSGLQQIAKKLTQRQLELVANRYFDTLNIDSLSNIKIARLSNHLQKLDENGYDYIKIYKNNKIINCTELTISEDIRKSRIWRTISRLGPYCWYTGEECIIDIDGKKAWSASEEHLIPFSRGGQRKNGNIVIAAAFINNKLENAPVHVKLHVRRELFNIKESIKHLSKQEKIQKYKMVIGNVLSLYKVKGRLPWKTAPIEVRQHIEKVYATHLNVERNFIDSFIGIRHNIRRYLEEICNGLDEQKESNYY